jgi:hypothetical protein
MISHDVGNVYGSSSVKLDASPFVFKKKMTKFYFLIVFIF